MQFIRYPQSRLPSNFWDDTEGLAYYKKVFLAYLYKSPLCNRLGCFYYPLDNIVQDLDYDKNDAIDDLYALEKNGFVSGDAIREWIYLPHYLKYFPVRNPNQGKHIEKLFYDIPWDCSFYPNLVFRLLCTNHLSNSFRKYLRKEVIALIKKEIRRKK